MLKETLKNINKKYIEGNEKEFLLLVLSAYSLGGIILHNAWKSDITKLSKRVKRLEIMHLEMMLRELDRDNYDKKVSSELTRILEELYRNNRI